MSRPTAAAGLARAAAVVALTPLLLSGPAHAAGTGGITVTPVPAVVDGEPVTSFRVTLPESGTREVPFTVSNVEDEPRSARLYLAPVSRNGEDFVLGEPGASPYASLADRRLTLQPGEVVESSFTVSGAEQPEDPQLAAVVLEVTNGAVTTQAATLVYVEPASTVPLPLLVVGAAVVVLSLAGAAVAVAARRRQA